MTRYLVAFVLLTVYVAGSALVVRHEGRVHRAQLKQEWLAAHPVSNPIKPPPDVKASDSAMPAATPEPAPPTEHSSQPTVTVAEKTTTTPEIASLPQPVPAAVIPAPAAREGVGDPFWNAPAMTRIWGLTSFTTEDEKQLGGELHALVLKFHPKVERGPMPRRVEETAELLVAARTRKDIDYTFTVLDSDVVNAFSHPGGYVYVTSGLMNWIGEDDGPSLEFILAHEIAHVDLRHALTCLRDPGVKALGKGTLQQFLLLIFPWGYYPDRLDLEADLWAYQQMTRLDRTKREHLAFLRKLEGYASDQGFENGRAKPELKAETSPVENHLKAHLAPYKRLKALNDLTKAAPAPAPVSAPARAR